MKFLCVGGEHEGCTIQVDVQQYTYTAALTGKPKETYVRLSVKGGTDFFMLAGMTPVAGLKRWQELTGLKQPA